MTRPLAAPLLTATVLLAGLLAGCGSGSGSGSDSTTEPEPTQIVDGRVATSLIRPVSRLGYMDYAVVEETFEMLRPRAPGAAAPMKKSPRQAPAAAEHRISYLKS